MQGIIITSRGIEFAAQEEIKEIIGKDSKIEQSAVIFDTDDALDLCRLCYLSQSASRVLLLLKKIKFSKQEDIFEAAKKIDFSEFIKDVKFRVDCTKGMEYEFNSSEIEEGIGQHIEGDVDLDNPGIRIHAYLYGKTCYIGIDFAGFDLSKRQYRIFNYKDSLKATIAYAMIRLSGYEKKDFLLDPFSGTGVIPIEAAIHACKFPVNYFSKEKFIFRRFKFMGIDKMNFDKFFEKIDKEIDLDSKTSIVGYSSMLGYVKASQKNAKIAGINKKLVLSRVEIDWIDTKIDKAKINQIVTKMPELTERNEGLMKKIYKEFFFQSAFVLKKNSNAVLACGSEKEEELIKDFAKEFKFDINDKIEVMQGKKQMMILAIRPKK